MTYSLFYGDPNDAIAKVEYLMTLFNQARLDHVNHAAQWEEIAALLWPEYRNSFQFGHNRASGQKYTQFQVDSSGPIALWRFMCIADALVTPHSLLWSVIRPRDEDAMKDKTVAKWWDDLTKALWAQRYTAEANFVGQQQQNWQCLGAFGNQAMLIDELDTSPGGIVPGLRYMAMSPGEVYPLQNHQGRVDGFIRHFRWTARQAFGRWKDQIPDVLKAPLSQNSATKYDFLHFVIPRTDFDPLRIFSPQGKRWWSCYVSVAGFKILEEGGYRTFPMAHGRYSQAPEEVLGRGPGNMTLPELKTVNAEKCDFLAQGHLAGAPVWLLGDDLFDFKAQSGAYIFGGLDEQGHELVKPLAAGQIQVTQEMIEDSKKIISAAFLNDLYPLLFSDKGGGQKSAREVIEMANDRGIFLAPTLGRQFGEYLGTVISRELNVMSWLGLPPFDKPIPQAVREAGLAHTTKWQSPLARALEGQAIAGFGRTIQLAQEAVNATGDPSIMDWADWDEAFPAIAREQFVPERWIADPAKLAAKRKARAQAQERDAQVKELPGKAAIIKAQAVQSKAAAGQNIGGVLSGVPAGGMPMMPGQTQPGGRSYG